MLNGNMLIAHGGGPTPVINSSLLGAVREAKLHEEIETIYGARFGAEGILAGDSRLDAAIQEWIYGLYGLSDRQARLVRESQNRTGQ